jgi:two-component system chemotaxis response regulator CheY
MPGNLFLLVDDQEEINLLAASLLAPYGECVVATNGGEALEVFADAMKSGTRFTAVLLDIMMPGMDGHEVARRLRQMEKAAGVPPAETFKLVMLTALADTKSVCRSFFREGMADAYLTKPLESRKLVEELRHLGLVEA